MSRPPGLRPVRRAVNTLLSRPFLRSLGVERSLVTAEERASLDELRFVVLESVLDEAQLRQVRELLDHGLATSTESDALCRVVEVPVATNLHDLLNLGPAFDSL